MTKNIPKLVDSGKVAVLYSPGFGAGWSTWNKGVPEIVFDPAIVKFVESERRTELETYVNLKYPDLYKGGMRDLAIAWLPEGAEFQIVENDGAERIVLKEEIDWMVA